VLSQIQNGIERPICYASQLYSKHEANYNITLLSPSQKSSAITFSIASSELEQITLRFNG